MSYAGERTAETFGGELELDLVPLLSGDPGVYQTLAIMAELSVRPSFQVDELARIFASEGPQALRSFLGTVVESRTGRRCRST